MEKGDPREAPHFFRLHQYRHMLQQNTYRPFYLCGVLGNACYILVNCRKYALLKHRHGETGACTVLCTV